MLATECARVLNYRDSYLLFNKNRSLYKIIATQPEKDDLISQEILPYSYRSRQIAIVTAKSMFRQFGSRVIQDGRRVRDDYWEAKARKQGFTEEDAAGEKRPGAAKARDAAAVEAAQNAGATLCHPDIIYGNGPLDSNGHPQGLQPAMGGHMPATLAPLPMISLAPNEDLRLRNYGDTPRPRQEFTGTPYQDRSQPTSTADVLHQASNTAEYSKAINEQRKLRGSILTDTWHRPHELPVTTPQPQVESSPAASQSLQSPPVTSRGMISTSQHSLLQRQPSQMMSPQSAYSQQAQQGNPLSQSPRGLPQGMRPDVHQRPSGLSYSANAAGQGSPYGYAQSSHGWGQPPPQPQPQQSPIAAHPNLHQYSPSQQHPSHPPQSPHQPPQLHHSQSNSSMHGGMGYQSMPSMSNPSSYSAMRSMYQQPTPGQQHYMSQTTAAQQAGMQGWAPPPQQGQHPAQGWPHGY